MVVNESMYEIFNKQAEDELKNKKAYIKDGRIKTKAEGYQVYLNEKPKIIYFKDKK